MEEDDPISWSVETVKKDICSQRILPGWDTASLDALGESLEEHSVTGLMLLISVDKAKLRTDLGVALLCDRNQIMKRIFYLRECSKAYQEFPQTIGAAPGAGTTTDFDDDDDDDDDAFRWSLQRVKDEICNNGILPGCDATSLHDLGSLLETHYVTGQVLLLSVDEDELSTDLRLVPCNCTQIMNRILHLRERSKGYQVFVAKKVLFAPAQTIVSAVATLPPGASTTTDPTDSASDPETTGLNSQTTPEQDEADVRSPVEQGGSFYSTSDTRSGTSNSSPPMTPDDTDNSWTPQRPPRLAVDEKDGETGFGSKIRKMTSSKTGELGNPPSISLKRPPSAVEAPGTENKSAPKRKRIKPRSGHVLNPSKQDGLPNNVMDNEHEDHQLSSDIDNPDSHGSRGELADASQSPADDWPHEDYDPENVVGSKDDPEDDTGSEICRGYDDEKVEHRSGVIEEQDLDLANVLDSAEAVERVASTTIAEQMGEGVAEDVAAFFSEEVENIKIRTYKMWLPGMRRVDENGSEVGLYSFQLVGVRFLVTNVKSMARGAFLCDDMGLGKTIQAFGVCQVLYNHAQLTYAVGEALHNANGTRTDPYGNIHQGKGRPGPCPSQKAIKASFGICCNCWEGSPTGFDVREGPVLNIVPPQLIWNWHRDWLKFFDPKNPLSIQHKVAHNSAKGVAKFDREKHGLCDPQTGVAPRNSNRFVVTTSPASVDRQILATEKHTFWVKAVVKSGKRAGQLGNRDEQGCWYRSKTNWSMLLRDECHSEKGENTAAVRICRQVNYGWTDKNPDQMLGREREMASRSVTANRRPDNLRIVCKSMTPPPVVCLSGTPFEKSPSDIKWYIHAMQDAAGYIAPGDERYNSNICQDEARSVWETHPELKFCTTKAIDKLERDYAILTAETDDNPLDEDTKRRATNRLSNGLGHIFKALTIRRQKGSNFFGFRVVDLPPGQHVDVPCALTMQQEKWVTSISESIGHRAQQNERARRLQFSKNHTERRRASFPYLGSEGWEEVIHSNDSKDIGADFVRKWYGTDEKERASPFYQKLHMLISGNSKVNAVRKILLRYVVGRNDWSGRPKRFVLLTEYPAVAFIWYLVRDD
jgi:hypothetical protein